MHDRFLMMIKKAMQEKVYIFHYTIIYSGTGASFEAKWRKIRGNVGKFMRNSAYVSGGKSLQL
jgi:hypothetical protein